MLSKGLEASFTCAPFTPPTAAACTVQSAKGGWFRCCYCPVIQRQKAEAAEAQCLKLGSDIAKEQNENARLTARVKGTEHHIRDILAQIDEAKGMHNLLLQSLGEANDNIQTGIYYS